MHNANDHKLVIVGKVVDRIICMNRYTKPRAEFVALRPNEWEVSNRIKRGFEFMNEVRCDVLRYLGREVGPDFGEVGLCRLG